MAVELFLGPVVEATVSKLIGVASEQLSLARGWKQDLRKFRGKMELLQGVLQDAEEKHLAGVPGMKDWLKQLRAVAEDAEEMFVEVTYENLRRQVAARNKIPRWKKVSYFFTLSNSNPLVFRLKMANKVRSLASELGDINDTANRFGLQMKLAAHTHVPEPRVTQTHSNPPSYVIGRDQDVDAVVSMLTDSSSGQKQLPVISIVGMGGMGKTTVAQKVRVSDKICSHFSKIMWVCVSESFEVGRILREMWESLTRTTCAITNRDTLVQEIKEKLAGGTYLLILDDVWNDDGEKWDNLRDCLLAAMDSNLGSRVVVTTRSEKVAGIMRTHPDHLHRLKGLEDDQCLEIIMKMTFGDYSSIPSGLMEIGRAIAEKCGGVPLVASVIGGTLCNSFDRNEWLSIRNKIDARGSLGEESQDRRIVDILKLSFHRLPKPALKQCFVFCSAFPKDSVMEKEVLVQMWMAEGYLSPSGKGVSMEDVGAEYFNDLIAYSLFQEEKRDSFGNVSACKMHDLVHDLASSITEGETVIFGIGSQNEVSEQVRHLNLTDGGVPTNFGDVAENLRTLLLKGSCSGNLLTNSRRLRVLSLCDTDTEQLPQCLSKSKRLSFLDISGTRVKELPEFIGKLYNLQTFKYMGCEDLEAPLEGIENLLNLRHIYFDREEVMPANIGRLVNLQTLKVFWVGHKKGFRIEELGSLRQLRGELEIKNLERVRDRSEAERAKLQEKAVEVLSLKFESERGSNHDEDVLEGLRPPSTLKILSIEGYGGSNLPSWVSEMRDLVELKIYSCKMLINIPRLDGFPYLRRVVISYCNGISMIGDGEIVPNTSRLEELDIVRCPELATVSLDGFSRLRKLSIRQCNKLSSIEGSISTLTSYCTALESLILRSCGNLGCIPDLDGLTSLKRIYIDECDQLEFLPSGLSSCTALESLTAESCKSLKCIPSLDGLTSLRTVVIEECDQLELLPDNLSSCAALESLEVRKCKNLKNIPNLDGLTSLRTVEINKCDPLEFLPSGLSSCAALKSLTVGSCNNLKCIPSLDGLTSLRTVKIKECDHLELLPDNLSSCTALEILYISSCKNLRFQGLDGLSLKSLTIADCDQLECLPSGLSSCTALEKLTIKSCENLVFAPKELEALRSLVHLVIDNCQKLKGNPTIPEESEIESLTSLVSLRKLEMRSYSARLEAFLSSIHYLPSIEELNLFAIEGAFPPLPQHIRCYTSLKVLTIKRFQLESLPPLQPSPHGLGELSSLTKLKVRNCDLISIPEGLKELPSLVELEISYCRNLRSFPAAESNFSCLTSLRRLTLGWFSDDLEEFPDLSSFPPTPNLEILKLVGWSKVTQLPHQIIQHLGGGGGGGGEGGEGASSLKELEIDFFPSLEALPEWLGNLSSLQSLTINSCDNLKHLPSAEAIQRLTKLHRLRILGCGKLEERYKGPEWSKISHIPNIKISGIQIKSDDRAS